MKKIATIAIIGILCLSMFSMFAPKARATGLPPVGYWKFDEGTGTTAADSSGNGNTGAVNGPLWVDGIKGKALSFDGVDDYVYVPHSSSLDLSGYQMSVEFWMKLGLDWYPGINHENMCVYDKGDAYTSSLIAGSGALRYNLAYVPVRETPETVKNSWAANTWFFVVEVYDDPYIKIYVNGVLDHSELVSGPIPHSGFNLCIGAHSLWIDQIWFNGAIDEFAIYNYARTADEIQADFRAYSGPVGYWKFDEGIGSVAYDSSGNGNTGTLTSSPQWVDGIVGTSLEFDGIDDVVMVPSSASLVVARTQNQLTLETWMKPTVTLDSSTTPMYLILKGNEYGFELNDGGDAYTPPTMDGKILFCMCLVSPSTGYLQPEVIRTNTNVWTAGTWYHLAATYDGNSLKIYVNGVLENSRQLTGDLWPTVYGGELYPLSIAAYTIGPHYTGGNLCFFKGILDEVKVYNYARAAEEIYDYVYRVHNLNTGLDYVRIQDAIDAPETMDNHTIIVDAGAYWENVVANKKVSLVGENAETTIIDGGGSDNVVHIVADGVNVSRFTIQNSGIYAGVRVEGSINQCNIERNKITNNGEGVYLGSSSAYNIVSENNITASYGSSVILCPNSNHNIVTRNNMMNNQYGIFLDTSFNNEISGNNIAESSLDSIYSVRSSNNTLSENNISASSNSGICIKENSENNTIDRNAIAGNGLYGIWLWYSSSNIIESNNLTNNTWDGIYLHGSNNNSVCGNNITNTWCGISLGESSGNSFIGNSVANTSYSIALGQSYENTFIENNITNNGEGIELDASSSNNCIYHNNFRNNTLQVRILGGDPVNIWDDGYPSGGNYWSDCVDTDLFSGPYQNETGSDGIWDHPYVISTFNTDHYPFAEFWVSPDLAIVNVTTSKTDCKPLPTVCLNFSASITVDVENQVGYIQAFQLTVYANETLVATSDYQLINGGATVSINLNWSTTVGFSKGIYTIRAVLESISGEIDTSDNSFNNCTIEVTHPGDINADKIVDIFDIVRVALAFSSTPADLNWDPNADINNDRIIDIFDIVVVALHFGEVG